MIDSLLNSIEKTFVNFTFRRLLFLITIFSIVIVGIYVFESYTKYGFYYRMEKKATLLEQLHELEKQGITDNSELASLYNGIISELEQSNAKPEFLYEPYEFFTGDRGIKMMSSVFIPFLLVIAGIVGIKKEDYKSFVTGIVIYSLICIGFALIIPTFDKIWINVAINVAFASVLLGVLLKFFGDND